LAAFSANGLFAGLSGLFLTTTLHQTSHALSGIALFLVFASGVASQLATARLRASRVLALGTISMLAGLVILVVSVRLSTPSLARPGRESRHRARLRHPRRAGRRHLRLGTAWTPQ
jgi:hypothetical protein